ncbi:MAG: response regulator [Verrucomicrobia bacterium]|nr:response regulator [Verrucomicrobiota bacterium]
MPAQAPRQTRLFASLVNVRTANPSITRAPCLPPTPASPTDRALRVLIAEDNEFNRRLALRQLASLGHQARTAAHGNEVLKLLEQEPADVLLLDCQMPELDGYQTARAIRQREAAAAHPDRRPLHIIALTANALPGQREKCLAAGMDDFLTKPVRVADLEAALRRAHQALAGPLAPGQEPASPLEPALDPTVIQALAGDPEGRQELGELFLATVHSQLDRLVTAARKGDAADLQAAAHSIKGSAVNFGARRLGRLAAELEGHAKLRQLDTAPSKPRNSRPNSSASGPPGPNFPRHLAPTLTRANPVASPTPYAQRRSTARTPYASRPRKQWAAAERLECAVFQQRFSLPYALRSPRAGHPRPCSVALIASKLGRSFGVGVCSL